MRTTNEQARVTRRHALQLMGAGAAFVAAGCGGSGGKREEDKSAPGFVKEVTARGLSAARYAETGRYSLNHLPWGIDNNGVALLGAAASAAPLLTGRLSPPPLTQLPTENLLFLMPDGRSSPLTLVSSFFALSRKGTAVFVDNRDTPGVYLARPGGVRQKVLATSAVPGAISFGACEISDRDEQVVVIAMQPASATGPAGQILLRGRILSGGDDSGSGGNWVRIADTFAPISSGGGVRDTLQSFTSIAVNDDGEMAFTAVRGDGSQAVYFVPVGGGGGTPVLLAATGGGVGQTTVIDAAQITSVVSLNEEGLVAFALQRNDNRSAIVKHFRGTSVTVAEVATGEIYTSISLNNSGGIAYTSQRGGGTTAPISRVGFLPIVAVSVEDGITFIGSGDRLFGRKAVLPRLGGPRGLNDNLQMAISVGREASGGISEAYDSRVVLSVSQQTL